MVSRIFASWNHLDHWFDELTEAMTKIRDLHRRWSKDADYRTACEALGEEFDPRAGAD